MTEQVTALDERTKNPWNNFPSGARSSTTSNYSQYLGRLHVYTGPPSKGSKEPPTMRKINI